MRQALPADRATIKLGTGRASGHVEEGSRHDRSGTTRRVRPASRLNARIVTLPLGVLQLCPLRRQIRSVSRPSCGASGRRLRIWRQARHQGGDGTFRGRSGPSCTDPATGTRPSSLPRKRRSLLSGRHCRCGRRFSSRVRRAEGRQAGRQERERNRAGVMDSLRAVFGRRNYMATARTCLVARLATRSVFVRCLQLRQCARGQARGTLARPVDDTLFFSGEGLRHERRERRRRRRVGERSSRRARQVLESARRRGTSAGAEGCPLKVRHTCGVMIPQVWLTLR
jgi:hypothetical protein